MHTPERDIKILNCVKNGRSNVQGANRMNMTVGEYVDRKNFLKNQLNNTNTVVKDNYITVLEDKIVEQQFDLDKGTGVLKGIFSHKPMSADEIEIMFKIDLVNWKLSTYWNKAQSNGTFLVSANITRRKTTDVVTEDMLAAVKTVFLENTIVPYTYMQGTSNSKTLMVYTSDKHVGAYVPENALYLNTYNSNSFTERMIQLLEEIFYLETTHGKFENVYIIDLGDALDGWNGQTTRGGHQLPQNMNNRQAFETYLKAHKMFFDQLIHSGVANNYHFKAVSIDNHCADFGYITNRSLEEYLNIKYPQVETQIMTKFMEHFVVGKHTFILSHGKDDSDMKHGLPLVLNDKTINFINHYLDENEINSKTSVVHLVKGDLHQDSIQPAPRFIYRNTCSMFGSSKWAMHNFLPQAPGVSFDIIENDTKRVFPYTMHFTLTTP